MAPDPRPERIEFRASADEAAAWRAAADLEKVTLADWIRRACNARSGDPCGLKPDEIRMFRALITDGAKPRKKGR